MKTKLPERDDMFRRLVQVADMEDLKENFYPKLIESAGRELVSSGVIIMFVGAIHDYAKIQGGTAGILLYQLLPDYIDAIVDDEEVAKSAKAYVQGAMSRKNV